MTDQITVPRKTWDATLEALEQIAHQCPTDTLTPHRIQHVGWIATSALAAANAVSHAKPKTTPAPEGGAITSESAANAVSHPQATEPAPEAKQ